MDAAALLAAIRERHQCIPRHAQTTTNFFTGEKSPWPSEDACGCCEVPWPCDATVLLARVERLERVVAAARDTLPYLRGAFLNVTAAGHVVPPLQRPLSVLVALERALAALDAADD